MNGPENSASQTTPEEFELSQDQELWELLGNTSSPEASSLFSRNVVREIRLQKSDSPAKQSFWHSLLSPRVLVPSALAALALGGALLWNPRTPDSTPVALSGENEAISQEVASSLESSLESELLLAAADTPELFSDEEVIAMLL